MLRGGNETWLKLLEAKYMPDENFFDSKTKGVSQFWRGLHKVKRLFKWGALPKVGDGSLTAFWGDVWLGQSLLKTQFPSLFNCCEDPTVLVAAYWDNGEWTVNFGRNLTPRNRRVGRNCLAFFKI